MPGLVLSPHNHMGNAYPPPYHQQGLAGSGAYTHPTQHVAVVPSGYDPNSVHQYPRQPPPAQDGAVKPLRPAERMRLRPWLIKMIEEQKIPGLEWEDREQQTVKIPWKHAARHGWVKDRDASLFKAWAIHTKKYNPATDTPKANPKMWKANFRCAINSLPDIEELRERGKTKGNDAYKVYRLIPRTKGAAKLKSADPNRAKKPRKPKMVPIKLNKASTAADTRTDPSISDPTSNTLNHGLDANHTQPQKVKVELTVCTSSENHFQSPLSSPVSVTSSQPSTPLSAGPLNVFRTAPQHHQWLAAMDQNYLQTLQYQRSLEPYQNGLNDQEDYLSNASGSDMTDEEIVDMVDEMIQDSPINSPTTTVPSSPLDYDGNNNNHLMAYAHPLSATHLASNLTSYLTDYHSSQMGVVKVEPQSEDCSSPTTPFYRGAPPSYHDAVAGRFECIKEEPSPTYHSL